MAKGYKSNPPNVKQGSHTIGQWRAIAVTPDRKLVADSRSLIAHINEDGDVVLIGEYQAGFVEVLFSYSELQRLCSMATRRREEEDSTQADSSAFTEQ